MPEPPYQPQPRLRPHRLIPAESAAPDAEDLATSSVQPVLETWALTPGAELPPQVAEAGRALAQQGWLVIEKAALTLDALPAILTAAGASEEALETLKLIGKLLLALPDQLAAGTDVSIGRVDWMFARLLNTPGHPGLIEQALLALNAADAANDSGETPADHTAELETLRCLHRDLVTLQQEWDDLLAPLFSEESMPEQPEGVAESVGAVDNATDPASPPAPGWLTPLPEGLVVALSAEAAGAGRAQEIRRMRRKYGLLGLVMAALLLVISGAGILLLRSESGSSLPQGNAALSIGQHTPTAATAPSQPTSLQPTSTAPTSPQSPPRSHGPVAATPTPSPGPICWSGATFCPSTLWLETPCAGQGSVTFQLTNITNSKQDWQAISSLSHAGVALVIVSPAGGHLKANETITLTVQANASGRDLRGMLTISSTPGTLPVIIALSVCG